MIKLAGIRNKEKGVQKFLLGGLPLVTQEPATTAWCGLRRGPGTFCVLGAVPDEAGRKAHLSETGAWAFMTKADELFSEPLSVEKIDALASRLPDQGCPSKGCTANPQSVAQAPSSLPQDLAQTGNGAE